MSVKFVTAALCCVVYKSVMGTAFQPVVSPPLQSKLGNPYHFHQKSANLASFLTEQCKVQRAKCLHLTHSDKESSNAGSKTMSNTLLSNKTRATAVYALILANLGLFLADKVFQVPFVMQRLYLFHKRWRWWQPLTTCFCHSDKNHLSSNLFLLLLFGRSVEDDLGWGGLIFSYVVCGVIASISSLILLPKSTVSIGASGAVFGLFAVSTVAKLSWEELLDWRKLVEVTVLGEFVFRQVASELSVAAKGGRFGINHVAHLSGAMAGFVMTIGMRTIVANFEQAEKEQQKQKEERQKHAKEEMQKAKEKSPWLDKKTD